MTENATQRLTRLLLILAAGGHVRDDVLVQAEQEALHCTQDTTVNHQEDFADPVAA